MSNHCRLSCLIWLSAPILNILSSSAAKVNPLVFFHVRSSVFLFFSVNGAWKEVGGGYCWVSVNRSPTESVWQRLEKLLPWQRWTVLRSEKKRCVGWKEKIKPAVATTFTDASRHTLALLHSKDESCHWRAQIDKFYSDETTAMRSDNDTIYNGADVSPWQPVWWGKHVFGGYEMPDAGVKVR